ncbi:unnamed protein product [Leptosia nina]|uniref:SHSP domain-containing protein n=1 Tax=Leptosia nina TaxID=320188 RepID=A0AAV1JF98_9NEOP
MLLRPLLINSRPHLYTCMTQIRHAKPTIQVGKDKFQLFLDVSQFTKDEIRVKARPEYVIIEGKQERKTKDGYIIRKFFRKFKLPDGVDPQSMKSELSSEGCLIITAPRQACEVTYPCETVIPITRTEAKPPPEPFLKNVNIEKSKAPQKEPPKDQPTIKK